ncbi:MAG: Holliday junction resolvase RuvX [Clostridia bacterium]|nr:Holliday junction resolvase RuvX [Clostridia bacterium]
MIILSVDFGDARTGIAVCDPLELLASPVTVIHETYLPKVAKQVSELAAEHHAELVVVGDPVNMDGTRGERSEKCREFAELLEREYGLHTAMMDERLTTVEAHRALNATNVRGKERKNVVDAVAAVIILEDYLKTRS